MQTIKNIAINLPQYLWANWWIILHNPIDARYIQASGCYVRAK